MATFALKLDVAEGTGTMHRDVAEELTNLAHDLRSLGFVCLGSSGSIRNHSYEPIGSWQLVSATVPSA